MSTKKESGKRRVSKKKVLDDVNLWANRLGESNWHILVDFDESANQHFTTFAEYREGYREARICFSMKLLSDRDRRAQTLDIIHELRHLHYEPLRDKLHSFVGGGTLFSALSAEVEKLCDRDALFFYRLFSRRKKVAS